MYNDFALYQSPGNTLSLAVTEIHVGNTHISVPYSTGIGSVSAPQKIGPQMRMYTSIADVIDETKAPWSWNYYVGHYVSGVDTDEPNAMISSYSGLCLNNEWYDTLLPYPGESTASKAYKASNRVMASYKARLDSATFDIKPLALRNQYRCHVVSIAPMVGDSAPYHFGNAGRGTGAIANWVEYDGQYIAAYSMYARPTVQDIERINIGGVSIFEIYEEMYKPATLSRRGSVLGTVNRYSLPRPDWG